jgi:hypothetical protein
LEKAVETLEKCKELVIRKIDKERGSQLKSARQGALKYLEEN